MLKAMQALAAAGVARKWGAAAAEGFTRRSVLIGELRQVGVKAPEGIAAPSVRNDAAFLFTVIAVFSVLAVASSFLPGDIGFFTSYLVGGVPLVVLAIGSTNPAILSFFIDKFSQVQGSGNGVEWLRRRAWPRAAHGYLCLSLHCCSLPALLPAFRPTSSPVPLHPCRCFRTTVTACCATRPRTS